MGSEFMRKIFGIMLFCVLSLVTFSCSSKEQAESENIISNETDGLYTTEKFWRKTECIIPERTAYIQSLSYQTDGILRISTTDQESRNQVWDSKNQGKSWKNSDADMSLSSENGYHYSSEGNLFVYDSGKLAMSAGDGTESKTLDVHEGDSIFAAAMSRNALAVLVQNTESSQPRLEVYNPQTMECTQLENAELSEYLNASSYIGTQLSLNSSGEILYMTGAGIGRYDLKRDMFDYLIDQETLNGLTNPGEEIITSFAVDDTEEKLVLGVVNPMKDKAEIYLCEWGTWKEEKQASKDKLRIYSLKENGSIRQAADFFQEKCPELEVSFETGYTGKDGVTISDAIKTLNTELMAGEGPDILLLEGLPVDSYIEKEVLEDITDIIDSRKEKVFYNIISSYNGSGKIYQIPTSFCIPVLLGDTQIVSAKNNDELTDILKERVGNGTPLLSSRNFAEFAGNMFITSDILQERVNEEKLADYYRDLMVIAEQSLLDGGTHVVEEYRKLSYWAKIYPFMGSDMKLDLYFEEAQMGIDTIRGLEAFTQIFTLCKDKGLSYQYLNRDKGNYFIATGILGINRAGKHTETAKQFIEYYLSGEVQRTEGYIGLSVIRECLGEIKYVSESGELLGTISRKDTPDEKMDVYKLTPAQMQEIILFFEGLNTPIRDDAVVLQKVMEQADACLFEGKNPDSAAKEVCSEINLYLSE